MKMKKCVWEKLNSMISERPPEIGGILGSADGITVTEVILDQPLEIPKRACSYSPNTASLNSCIQRWEEAGIRFVGIFHTHFAGVKTLSRGDMRYIFTIMAAMPERISQLYFPVLVFPQREMVVYIAARDEIHEEMLELVK